MVNTSVWQETTPLWVDTMGPRPVDGVVPDEWRRFVAWRLGGDGAALMDGYECYVVVERIVVPLEAAASSPFMDA